MQKNATTEILDTYELAQEIEALRVDVQRLSSVVGRLADERLGWMQSLITRAANQVGEAAKQNPGSALAIAIGLGFLFGIFIRL
jgi:hypothetical protein